MIEITKEKAMDITAMTQTGGWSHIECYIDDKIELLKHKLCNCGTGVEVASVSQSNDNVNIVTINTNVYLTELKFWVAFKKKIELWKNLAIK